MSWKTIAAAPKDIYLLGISAKTKRPFRMIWNVLEERFVASAGKDDVTPTHFMLVPEVPSKNPAGWLPLDQGPRTGYCLGYDQCLKSPFVMRWHPMKKKFVATDGMGDEEPSMCMLLPSLADLFVELETIHQAEVSWWWTTDKLHDMDYHILVDESVNAKVKKLVSKYGITDHTNYRTEYEGRLFLSDDRSKVEQAANELAQHMATLKGVLPLSVFV
ncbi:hypothetical protein WJ97_13835 [Burkholderia ubonensis]|uniref:hypothetical protein n=1 Tax=Burkholderia ubonensis TaxID=101571 RepID=UPI000751F508|nr:hypothetical protein [Burkholderia ubonensis]KVP96901.1 hypothetical protein WJ97_13835 [Burkholderia ubonensis]